MYRVHERNMSRNVGLLEHDSLILLKKALDDPNTAADLRAKAAHVLGYNWMVLAGSYFGAGSPRDAVRCALNSLRLDPAQLSRLLGYPFRRLSKAHRAPRMEHPAGR